MRQNRTYGTLLAALALAGGMLCGCSSETENMSATENGGYISFSVADNASRTMIDPSDPTTIKWVENDTVTIYSPDCVTYTDDEHTEASHFAEYTVHIDADGTAKLNFNKYGLVWPKYEDCPTCRFYAVQGPEKAFHTAYGNIKTYDEGYLLLDADDPFSMYAKEYTSGSGERCFQSVKPYLLAEATYKNRTPVSLSFKSYSSTIDFCITNLTGSDIGLNYIDTDAYMYGFTYNRGAYVKWNIAKHDYEHGNLKESWYTTVFYCYSYNFDNRYLTISNNEKVHIYYSVPFYGKLNSVTPYYFVSGKTGYEDEKSGTIDLSDYTFECGKVYKMAINIGPKYVVKGNATQNGTLTIEQQNPGMTYTGTVNF